MSSLRQIINLTKRIEYLEASEGDPTIAYSACNVSNPPTGTELDGAFGAASDLAPGWSGIVDDAGADTTVWFVTSSGSSWFYEQLTKAA